MRISSTESLQGDCCTQILYIDNSHLHPSATFQILLLDKKTCFQQIKLTVENKSSTRKKLCNILYETFRLFYNILHENNLIKI